MSLASLVLSTVSLVSSSGLGAFQNDTSARTTSLPTFTQKRTKGTYQVYRSQQIQKYIAGSQDGIYHLLVVNALTVPLFLLSPLKGSLRTFRLCIPKQTETTQHLIPRQHLLSLCLHLLVGVVTSDPQDSITRETLDEQLFDYNVGFGITAIQSDTTGTAHTIFTTIEHGLNGVISVGIADSGAGYGGGSAGQIYNAKLVSGDDTCWTWKHRWYRCYC